MANNTGEIKKCRSCNSDKLSLVVDLGDHGWCNDFLTRDRIGKEKKYPLTMVRCEHCGLAQLTYTVPKEVMFSNHTYVSGTTDTLKNHFRVLANENINQFDVYPNDIILDIGGNDGTQLAQYKELGCINLLNVESASNIASISRKKGITTISDFFNETLIDNAKGLKGKCKIINASGVFFHLEELHSAIKGIKKALRKDGVFICQFMYFGDMLENTAFDGIYHEHLCYYSLKSLENLLEPYGFEIFDAYHSDIHGGSAIAKISFKGSFSKTDRYGKFKVGDSILVNDDNIKLFGDKVLNWRADFLEMMCSIKNAGYKVYGFGAPAKGNTLLTYGAMSTKFIENLFEKNPLKFNKWTPITHIPVVEENLDNIEDDCYGLLLSWNFKDEIIKNIKKKTDKYITFIDPFKESE